MKSQRMDPRDIKLNQDVVYKLPLLNSTYQVYSPCTVIGIERSIKGKVTVVRLWSYCDEVYITTVPHNLYVKNAHLTLLSKQA